jgi:diamine N-acetyltransferase
VSGPAREGGSDLIGPYYLWKLLIDHRFQHCGYGSATLGAIAGYLATRLTGRARRPGAI